MFHQETQHLGIHGSIVEHLTGPEIFLIDRQDCLLGIHGFQVFTAMENQSLPVTHRVILVRHIGKGFRGIETI